MASLGLFVRRPQVLGVLLDPHDQLHHLRIAIAVFYGLIGKLFLEKPLGGGECEGGISEVGGPAQVVDLQKVFLQIEIKLGFFKLHVRERVLLLLWNILYLLKHLLVEVKCGWDKLCFLDLLLMVLRMLCFLGFRVHWEIVQWWFHFPVAPSSKNLF